MIVKVQLSIESNVKGHTIGARMLVYNKDKSVVLQSETPKDIANLMDGRLKAFFHAEIVGKEVIVQGEAPRQNW